MPPARVSARSIAAQLPDLLALAGLLLVALALRWYLLETALAWLDLNETVTGLAAQHILAGDRPLFLDERSSVGALGAYLTAAVFAFAGATPTTLRIVPTALSLGFIVGVYLLGRSIWSRPVGWWSAIFATFGPAFLLLGGLRAGNGALDALALGTLALGLAATFGRTPGIRPAGYLLGGLLLGLAIWTDRVGLIYLPMAVALAADQFRATPAADPADRLGGPADPPGQLGESAADRPSVTPPDPAPLDRLPGAIDSVSPGRAGPPVRPLGIRPKVQRLTGSVLAGLIGLLLGLSPLLAAVWAAPGQVAFQLLTGLGAGLPTWPQNLRGLVESSLPILAGFLQPATSMRAFDEQLAEARIWQIGGLCITLAVYVAIGFHIFPAWAGRRRATGWWLALPLGALPIAFVVGVAGRDSATDPVFLAPIYSALPLIFAVILGSPGYRRRLRRFLLLGPLLLLLITFTLTPGAASPRIDHAAADASSSTTAAPSQTELIDFLIEHQIDAVYGAPDIVHYVDFMTGETIPGAAIEGVDRIGWNRYPEIAARADLGLNPAYVFPRGTAEERAFLTRLAGLGIRRMQGETASFTIFYQLSGRLTFAP